MACVAVVRSNIDPHIPTMAGWSTSNFHIASGRGGGGGTKQPTARTLQVGFVVNQRRLEI